MSGYKRATITLTRDEYDRLREAEAGLRLLPDVSRQEHEAISQETFSALQHNMDTLSNRQDDFRQIVSGFGESIRNYEEENSRRLIDAQNRMLIHAQQAAGNLWDQVTEIMDDQRQMYEQFRQETHQEVQAAITQFQQEIAQLIGNDQRKVMIARNWLDCDEAVIAFIEENYSCEFFTPGKISAIRRQIIQAAENLNAGMPESAVLSLQQQYFALSDLHHELENLTTEWFMLASADWEAARQISSLAIASDFVQAFDLEGNSLPYEINIAYWSNGALDDLITRLSGVVEALENPTLDLTTEVLREWRDVSLPKYYHDLEEIVFDARIRAINSQLRINIADLVVRALSDQGFSLITSHYETEDERKEYEARLTTLDGCEVIVKVSPTGNSIGENELHLQSLDREERTEHELQQRWLEMNRSLAGYGLDVGRVIREDKPQYAVNVDRRNISHHRKVPGRTTSDGFGSRYGN